MTEWSRRLKWRRGLLAILVATAGVGGLWAYDALGYRQLEAAAVLHADDAGAALRAWERFQTWHPTRSVLGVVPADTEQERLLDLRQAARRREWTSRLADLRQQAEASEADPEQAWRQFRQLCEAHPERSTSESVSELEAALAARRKEQSERRAAQARLADEHAIEPARELSLREPLQFQARRERYLSYLQRLPDGAFAPEATRALQSIQEQWDKQDFRKVRDHFVEKPGDVRELVTRCRAYLAAHPDGRFTTAAGDLLRWSERVTAPGEYRVTLRDGRLDTSLARFFSRGPDLSVELEVNGVRHGPSQIIKNRYDPDWNYEFPRRIRWKLGDAVCIRVTDHDWRDRVVVELASAANDPLSLRLLSGEVWSGTSWLRFESDFVLPVMPKIE